MDVRQHEWRKLPKCEQERQLFFEDKSSDSLLARGDLDFGSGQVSYRYHDGTRPKMSEREFWARKSSDARRDAAASVPKFIRHNVAATAAAAPPPPKRRSRGETRVRYYSRKNAAAQKDLSAVRTVFDAVPKATPAPPPPTTAAAAAAAPPPPRDEPRPTVVIHNAFDLHEEMVGGGGGGGGAASSSAPPAKKRRVVVGSAADGDGFLPDVLTMDGGGGAREARDVTRAELLAARHAAHARKVRETPLDTAAWLAFADFQAEFCAETVGGREDGRRAAVVAEKQLDILEAAVTYVDNARVSAELWVRLAAAAGRSAGEAVAEEVWRDALEEVEGAEERGRLWLAHLRWQRARGFASFSADGVRDAHRRALRDLLGAKHALLDAGGDDAALRYRLYHLEESLVYVTNSAALFERQLGYPERGLAVFQAALGVNTLVTDAVLAEAAAAAAAAATGTEEASPSFTFADRLEFFEQHWEGAAGVRLGEEGTLGKDGLLLGFFGRRRGGTKAGGSGAGKTGAAGAAPATVTEEEVRSLAETVHERAVYKTWLRKEVEAHGEEWQPCRAGTAAAEANPERVVFLEDVEGYLVPLYEPGQHRLLFVLLLEYLGVPALFTQCAMDDAVLQMTLLCDPAARGIDACFASDAAARCVEGRRVEGDLQAAVPYDEMLRFGGAAASADAGAGAASAEKKGKEAASALAFADELLAKFDWVPESVGGRGAVEKTAFARRVLDAARCLFPADPLFPVLLFDLYASSDLPRALEIGRALLAKERDNTFLWVKFASLTLKEGVAAMRREHAAGAEKQGRALLKKAAATATKVYHGMLAKAGGGATAVAAAATQPPNVVLVSLTRSFVEGVLLPTEVAASAARRAAKLTAAAREQVVHVLCCAAEGAFKAQCAAGPGRVVAARGWYKGLVDRAAAAGEEDDAPRLLLIEAAGCAAMLELLSTGPREALKVYQTFADALRPLFAKGSGGVGGAPARLQHQHFAVSHARFAVFAMFVSLCQANSFEPRLVKDVLQAGCEAHPLHPVLTAAYSEFELVFGRTHSVRLYFAKALEATRHHPLVYLYSILVERRHLHNPVRAKRLFLSALAKDSCRATPLLWLQYMEFEAEMLRSVSVGDASLASLRGDLVRALSEGARVKHRRALQKKVGAAEAALSAVKSSFFRCVAELPGSVVVWLRGLEMLIDAVAPEDVQQVIDLMHEKELHVRVFVEEVALDVAAGVKA